jgi:hypothetical protein
MTRYREALADLAAAVQSGPGATTPDLRRAVAGAPTIMRRGDRL